jgi:hypothetical protein
LADLTCSDAELILAGLDGVGTWDAVIDAEPGLALVLSGEQFDDALLAIANFVDLKSPYTLGHARAVAGLVAEAGTRLGLPEPEVRTLRRAGLVHDLGRLGVSNAIWDKPGPLGAGEWERVRIHPYLTERMLHQSDALAPLATIAVAHRERLDGSGYPRGLSGSAISRPARILAAADAYQAMREPRPYRPPRSPEEAATELRADVKAGRLDADAVEAVLSAAGHRVPRRRGGARGTDRARGGGAPAARPRPLEQGDCGTPRHLAENGPGTTSSTSTQRSTHRHARPRACSRCSTASSRRMPSKSRPEAQIARKDGANASCGTGLRLLRSLIVE